MSETIHQFFSRQDDDALDIMNELKRHGIFFIEEKSSQRWVEADWGPNFSGEWLTNNPNRAKTFDSKFEAMTWMIQHTITFDKFCITEHEFVSPNK